MLELGGGDFPWVGRYQLAAAERRVRAGPGRACARGGRGAPGRPLAARASGPAAGRAEALGSARPGPARLVGVRPGRRSPCCRWRVVPLGWRTGVLPSPSLLSQPGPAAV